MIIPVLFYWSERKGYAWAKDLADYYSFDETDTTRRLQVEHREDGFIPLPEGLVLTHVSTSCLPMDRGAYDHPDFLSRDRKWDGVLVYTDADTAKWLEEERSRQEGFNETVRAHFA